MLANVSVDGDVTYDVNIQHNKSRA